MYFEKSLEGTAAVRVVIVMEFDYYYGPEADTYAFYRIPKVLFTEEHFSGISAEAKTLYGILLDRMNLSARNGWVDEQGRVYIICTLRYVMEALGCADQKATKLFNELEYKAKLIERVRMGQGKPNRIYVKNFIHTPRKSRVLSSENHDSGAVNITNPETGKSRPNNIDINNTEFNNNNLILSESDGMDEREATLRYIREKVEYDILIHDNPYDRDLLDEMIAIMVDTICSGQSRIMISGDYKPAAVVRSQLMKLDGSHISYVLDCFRKNTTKVKNVRAYLLSSLYNAPLTIGAYYTALVSNDMAEGRI